MDSFSRDIIDGIALKTILEKGNPKIIHLTEEKWELLGYSDDNDVLLGVASNQPKTMAATVHEFGHIFFINFFEMKVTHTLKII